MGSEIDELEQEMLGNPHTSEALTVYGDALLATGDIRGEIITTDLALDRDPGNATLASRRLDLLRAWLGNDALVGADQHHARFRYGFVQYVATHALEKILENPACTFAREIHLRCYHEHVAEFLRRLVAAPRRWLHSLTIETTTRTGDKFLVGPELARALVEATPHLDTLTVDGTRVLGNIVHPRVRRIRIRGWSAMKACFETGSCFPSAQVVELDLATTIGARADLTENPQGVRNQDLVNVSLLPAENFPNVRELDVSHNVRHRGYQNNRASIFRVLASVGVVPQLHRLRLPPIDFGVHESDVGVAIARAPNLERIEIMQQWGEYAPKQLSHPRAAIIVRPRPWPSRDRMRPQSAVHFAFGMFQATAALDVIVEWLEPRFESLADDVRAAWTRVFEILDDDTEDGLMSHASLALALDRLTDLGERDRGWEEVRKVSRQARELENVIVSPTWMPYGA